MGTLPLLLVLILVLVLEIPRCFEEEDENEEEGEERRASPAFSRTPPAMNAPGETSVGTLATGHFVQPICHHSGPDILRPRMS